MGLSSYNNKHWLSDVIAGAGLGVLSTQAGILLVISKIKKVVFWEKEKIIRWFYLHLIMALLGQV